MWDALRWRLVGPFRGGRVSAVVGHPRDRLTFFFGACAGGVFRTEDGGITWQNVSDGFFSSASVGALAISSANPDVVYAGTGEANIRTNVCAGDGLYRSGDGGTTWARAGLEDTQHIARVVVHPEHPDVVYVAALGPIWGPGGARGIFRSRDGGQHWDPVLTRDPGGAIDLVMDPKNPRVLYGALWDVSRSPHGLRSGGPGSGMWRTQDGGEHWTEVTRAPGLPAGVWGRVGIAVSADPGRVWATIEAGDGGVFVSEDGGDHWERCNAQPALRLRPWYFSRVVADPAAGRTVYALNLNAWQSQDGGRTFIEMATPHADHHDLWIDPRDPLRMISGHDGGATVSFDGGRSWSSMLNQPTGQFYHVAVDHAVPYRLYGAQQDNTTLSVPSRTDQAAITLRDCYSVGGGESGWIAVPPDDPSVVYAGSNGSLLTRYDHRSHQRRVITPWPEEVRGWAGQDLRYRFAWSFPVVLSHHDASTLYVGANVLFRSRDQGHRWEEVSPDLTQNDPASLGPSGGPVTLDNGGAEMYGTLSTVAESPRDPLVIWAGSDDGQLHVTRDGGGHWTLVTPPDLPALALMSTIEASPHRSATAYLAATRYKLADPAPYVFKTHDYGQHWTRIVEGVEAGAHPRVIREDPERPGLLWLGTERGVLVSDDEGQHWVSCQLNLPTVPIYDLVVHAGDIVVATHGRGFWILDDITPLYGAHASGDEPVRLARPRPTIRWRSGSAPRRAGANRGMVGLDTAVATWERLPDEKGSGYRWLDAGENPPPGVVVTYALGGTVDGPVSLIFREPQGAVIKEFRSDAPSAGGVAEWFRVQTSPGGHRFVWDMRYPDALELPGAVFRGGSGRGPLALPGLYEVCLVVGESTVSAAFEILPDPRVPYDPLAWQAQFDFLIALRDHLSQLHRVALDIRGTARLLEQYRSQTREGLATEYSRTLEIDAASRVLRDIERRLVQPEARIPLDYLKMAPGLNATVAALMTAVESADGMPTEAMRAVFADLQSRTAHQWTLLQDVMHNQVQPLLRRLADDRTGDP